MKLKTQIVITPSPLEGVSDEEYALELFKLLQRVPASALLAVPYVYHHVARACADKVANRIAVKRSVNIIEVQNGKDY